MSLQPEIAQASRMGRHPILNFRSSQVEGVQRAAGPANSEMTGKRQFQLQPKL